MTEPIITVENLSKRYRIGAQERANKSFREVFLEGITAPIRNLKRLNRMTRFKENNQFDNPNQDVPAESENDIIWALKDVSFEVREGEVLGVIGRNGAGKSTLLKILSRVTEPTIGDVKIYGRISSLLEVGTGFHPELTGRENIFLNGAILGMRKKEIEGKFDEIVAFAETEKFLDTPVKYYSSGMYVRLAFAVAAYLEPEILLVDEVLAVGDGAFQKKCLGRMGDVAKEGRTILFVSHNMQAVANLCGRAILLDQGGIVKDGESKSVVARYLTDVTAGTDNREQEWNDTRNAPGTDRIRLHRVCIHPEGGGPTDEISMETPICFEVEYWNLVADSRVIIEIGLYTIEGSEVLESESTNEPTWHGKPFPEGLFRSVCRIPGHFLNEGTFRIRLIFFDETTKFLYSNDQVVVFSVQDLMERDTPWYGKYKGPIRPLFAWSTDIVTPTPLSINR